MDADTPAFIRATSAAYDTIADEYAEECADWAGAQTFDRALISGFAELVKERGREPVADVGSGPGAVTARLHALGVPVFGIDISSRMVAMARRTYPELRFHVGSMTSLDLPDATLGGIAALYSIIHVPDAQLPGVFAEFRRVLVPGGYLLLAFQFDEKDDRLHLDERFGHAISLDYYWRKPETVVELLTAAGFQLHSRTVREPQGQAKYRKAYVVAHTAQDD
ncbi:SAM-dependent methyltransferase [Streptomyces sp. Act143]|uniref:class I SAM-dependent DNA methyltransferase n=1 Tax=Streptomyces sp. Act143 TaxID=2200760 RepID=UPI000D67E89E|nr:class I SAM-dependent methyltransferase [Streptomyces sp. Act143]PWI17646.1 SAM-dependent methyltransferase [Streptomyces sp. Act143]